MILQTQEIRPMAQARFVDWRQLLRSGGMLVGLFVLACFGCRGSPGPDRAVMYIAFGDSTTRGPAGRDYVGFLHERLGEPREAFAVEASGGETAGAGRERFRRLLDEERYPNAHTLLYWQGGAAILRLAVDLDPELAHSPLDPDYPHLEDLVRVLDRVEVEIQEVIVIARDAGLAVYVATYYPPPEFQIFCQPMPDNVLRPAQAPVAADYIVLLNERIRRAAVSQGAFLVDVSELGEELRSNPASYFDCNHLSARGNELVAELFHQVITASLQP